MEHYEDHIVDAISQRWPDSSHQEDIARQLICLQEEVGELTKEVRKYLGWARTPKYSMIDMADEMADVEITLRVLARLVRIDDLDDRVEAKLAQITERGGL